MNSVTVIPDFRIFNFTRDEGAKVSFVPYEDAEPSEYNNIINNNTAKGAAIGAAIGAAVVCPVSAFAGWATGLYSVVTGLIGGAFGGGAAGGIAGVVVGRNKGIRIAKQYKLNRAEVKRATHESAEKAEKIIEAFIKSQLNGKIKADMRCTLNKKEIMVYPVDVNCGSSHTFEFYNIFDTVVKEGSMICPECKLKSGISKEIDIKECRLNKDIERKIHEAVTEIFINMELLLQKLPKQKSGMPNFSESKNINDLAAKVKEGQGFLSGDIQMIIDKLNNPDTLSLEERYALGNFLVNQFKPLQKKINDIYVILSAELTKIKTEGDPNDIYKSLRSKVDDWHGSFTIIPQQCKILNQLYSMVEPCQAD